MRITVLLATVLVFIGVLRSYGAGVQWDDLAPWQQEELKAKVAHLCEHAYLQGAFDCVKDSGATHKDGVAQEWGGWALSFGVMGAVVFVEVTPTGMKLGKPFSLTCRFI